MAGPQSESKQMGRLMALSQIGFEMVLPIGLGLFLDDRFGWTPWGVSVGAVLGLAGGLTHLVFMTRRFEKQDRDAPPKDQP